MEQITINAIQKIDVFIAFTAGFLTFLSPCVIPLIPSYFAMLTGFSVEDFKSKSKKEILLKIIYKTLLFSLGFSLVFILLGATATTIGKFLNNYKLILLKIGGIIILIFGFYMLELINIKFLNYEKKISLNSKIKNSFFFPFLFGIAFSLGWSPCIGPILGNILIYASSKDSVVKGMIFLGFYSISLSTIFLISGIIYTFLLTKFSKINKYSGIIKKVSGVLMIIFGILLFFNKFNFYE